MPPSAKNTEYGIWVRYWRLVYCSAFHCTWKVPIGVGSSWSPVMTCTGPRVTAPLSINHARRSATSTHALATDVHGVPSTAAGAGAAAGAGERTAGCVAARGACVSAPDEVPLSVCLPLAVAVRTVGRAGSAGSAAADPDPPRSAASES